MLRLNQGQKLVHQVATVNDQLEFHSLCRFSSFLLLICLWDILQLFLCGDIYGYARDYLRKHFFMPFILSNLCLILTCTDDGAHIKMWFKTHLSRSSSLIVVSTFAYFCCLLIWVGSLKSAEKTKVSSTVNCG